LGAALQVVRRLFPHVADETLTTAVVSRDDLLDAVDHPDYAVYITKAFKFYLMLLKLSDRWEWIPRVLGRAQNLIANPSPIKVKCTALALVSNALKRDATWAWFAEIFPSFLVNVLFPLFSLSNEDLTNSVDDPVAFVCEIHKIADEEMSDLRAGAAALLRSAAEHHADVVQSLLGFVLDILERATPSLVFAAVYCAISVLPAFSLEFAVLFQAVLPFADHPDHLCRAAAFDLAAFAAPGVLEPAFGSACIRHLHDPSDLVRHSAAVAFGHFLKLFAEDPESKAFICTSLQADIPALFQILLELSAVFGDWTLGDALFQLTAFFGSDLLPIAASLIDNFLAVMIASATDSHTQFAIMCSQSLQECVRVLSKFPEASPLYDGIFQRFLEAIPLLPLPFLQDSFLPAVQSLIAVAPFRPLFWRVLALATAELAIDFARLANLLCFKDVQLFESEHVIRLLRAVLDAQEFDAAFLIMAGLCLRAPPADAGVSVLLPEVLHALMCQVDEATEEAVQVADAMAIFAPELVGQILGESFGLFAAFVVDHRSYGFSPIAVIRLFESCSGGIRGRMVLHVVDFLRTVTGGGEEEEDDGDLEDGGDVVWFSREEVKRQAMEFLQKIDEKERSLDGVLFSDEFAAMAQSGSVIL
jgi:hypothetical protein